MRIFKKKPVYYISIEDISIYNWTKLSETNDFGWLCKRGKPDITAPIIYQNLLYQFNILNLEMLKYRKQLVVKAMDLVQDIIADDNIDFRILKGLSLLIRAFMIKPEKSDITLLSKMLKSSDQRFKLSLINNEKKRFEAILNEDKTLEKGNIYDRCAVLSDSLGGLKIDPKETSVAQYMAFESLLIKKNKKQK